MLRTLVTTAVLATALTTAMVPGAASAHDHDGYGWQSDRGDWGGDHNDWRGDRGDYRRDYRDARRDEWRYRRQAQGYYAAPAYGYAQQYGGNYYAQPAYGTYYQRESYPIQQGYYQQNNGYRCHSDGTAGAVLGAIAGGLIGNSVAGRGDRTAGALIGGAGGLFAGRAIERSGNRC